jgi:hypothetical protein
MGTPRRSKKYNLEIGANPLSFCQRSNEWVLRVVRGGEWCASLTVNT